MPDGERVRPPRWLKPVNKVFMVLLRLGVPISRVESPVVLTVPGRKTGKPRSTPVTPMDVDGKRYVVERLSRRGLGRTTCARQARSRWRRAAAAERVRMVEVSPDDARPVLRALPAAVPTGCRADGSGSA